MNDVNLLINNGVNIKESLELFGDMEMYNNSLRDFYKEFGQRLEKLKKYKETSDMANYMIEVHSLKSDSKYFGFDKLSSLCLEHEMESKKNNAFFVVDHYDELIDEAKRIWELISRYLGENFNVNLFKKENMSLKDKTILVVDDSNVTRNFVMKIFSKDYNVLVAKDGNDAINIVSNNLQNGNVVAMLLDLNMPKVNGYGVLDYFKTNNLFSKIPVSIITSDNSIETRNKVLTYGIVDILVKPFNERDIKQVLDKTIYFNEQL